MTKFPLIRSLAVCAAFSLTSLSLLGADQKGEDKVLFDPTDEAQVAAIVQEKAESAIVDAGGVKVLQGTFPTGLDYPTLAIISPSGEWDLSGKEGVEVEVTNKSNVTLSVAMRVDNAGDWQTSPWSTEAVQVDAGDTKTLQVKFGFSNGGQPSFALDPAHITAIKLFVVKPAEDAKVEFKDLKPF